MNILITGVNGFVGKNIVSHLHNEYNIYGLDIIFGQQIVQTFYWEDIETIPPVDVIIHLAGKAHDTNNASLEEEYFDINVGLTQKIFQYFLKSYATKFIFFSSVKAAADSVTGDQLSEDVLPNPMTTYGRSKLQAENYILMEWEKWRKEGESGRRGEDEIIDYTNTQLNENKKGRKYIDKKVYILRPCMIHGPGNKGNLNLLYKFSQKGFPWPLGAFENKRSFCSIDNILFVVEQLIEKDIEPGIYQVADDESLATNEVIRLIALTQNRKARIWYLPVKLIKAIAKIGDCLPIPLDSERLKKLTESYFVSNQKLKIALGIKKMPSSATEGMKKTFASFH
jgi:nucleoside-diphosphate-sugar epimerase